ncbi:phage tail assembly chaperone [Cohnella caldifontis]|uniref:phage tail assembly chaperone n=1 Tax=Cohnella caldifontis TaxID=3027471 RepID=UPI0023EDE327|nr:phage portal protein [Cohnella sp. YIM B05605]
MSEFSAFFSQNAVLEQTEEFVVSERFRDPNGQPIPWKLRTISESENEEIRKAATQMVRGKGGQRIPETKPEVYLAKVAAASVVYPDLKNAELQKSYGVIGAEDLLKKMLLAGEYAALVRKVETMNGFDRDINELVEEVKN